MADKISIREIRAQYPMYADVSDQQLLDGLHQKFYSDLPKDQFMARIDTGSQDVPGKLVSLGAGLGSGVGQVALGAQHYLGKGLQALGADSAGQWLVDDAAQGREKLRGEVTPYKDANPLTTGTGELAGNIAATLPVGGLLGGAVRSAGAIAPQVTRVANPIADAIASAGLRTGGVQGALPSLATRAAGGAVSGGVSSGLVDPGSAGTGAVIGALTPGVIAGAGRLGALAGQAIRPSASNAPLAQRAIQMGAPLGVADVSSNGVVKGLRSALNDSLFTGSIGQRQNDAKQAWFNRAVGDTFGANSDSLTSSVLDSAKKRLGSEFDRIWGQNQIVVDNQFTQSLAKLRQDASLLPEGEAKRLYSHIDDIQSRIQPDAAGNLVIPGDVANRFQSSLRRTADSAQGFLKTNLNELRQTVIGGFNRSVSPTDAAALKLTQSQYKAFKTVEPLLNKAEVGVAGRTPGDVPASLLPQAVVNSYRGNVANSPLSEVSQIGSRFIVDRTPQTGGSARAALQNTAVGGLLVGGGLSSPLTLAAIPAAMGINKALGSPAIARRLVNSQPQGLLASPATGGLLDLTNRSVPLLMTSP